MEEGTLYLQLHKLSAVNSREDIDRILTTLWRTRRTGLSSLEKAQFQSLLNLTSLPQLDPVLACLRSLVRKCVHDNFTGDDLLKLFPPDLSLDLQSILGLLLQQHQNQWKEELSKEKTLPRTSVSYQVKTNVPPSFTSVPPAEISSFWPCQDNPGGYFNGIGTSTSINADTAGVNFAPFAIQHDVGALDNVANLPCLKSMTWTMENCNSAPADRLAIISLKLQDHTKSPSREMEVKFQLNRDTLEAMVRSMTYINEQLSSMAVNSSVPPQKKQKQ
uniref:Uncharacterized protein LOC8268590 isoform X2 n=1 Tax=Rhizophora mucronata TaxID=61149 RepID=A0A2P2JZG5_RHIMU